MPEPDFSEPTKTVIRHRASYICSNPNCQQPTLLPSTEDDESFIMDGEVAHIKDARPKTSRYDPLMTDPERAHINNGIYLCGKCHIEIDKNNGKDYPAELLSVWNSQHHSWLQKVHHERIQGITENISTTINIKDGIIVQSETRRILNDEDKRQINMYITKYCQNQKPNDIEYALGNKEAPCLQF